MGVTRDNLETHVMIFSIRLCNDGGNQPSGQRRLLNRAGRYLSLRLRLELRSCLRLSKHCEFVVLDDLTLLPK